MATTSNYTVDLNTGLTQVLADGTNTYLCGNGRIAEQISTTWTYYHPDALGSVRHLSDSTGTLTLGQSYEPFGDKLSSAGSSNYGFKTSLINSLRIVKLTIEYINGLKNSVS